MHASSWFQQRPGSGSGPGSSPPQPPPPPQFCNNCGQRGHLYNLCKNPIMSNGVIAFRFREADARVEYLMIRRQNTLGFIDFVRGKYNLLSYEYILHMLRQMTESEKTLLEQGDFQVLWDQIWNGPAALAAANAAAAAAANTNPNAAANAAPAPEVPLLRSKKYKNEENQSREKYHALREGVSAACGAWYDLRTLVARSRAKDPRWDEAEWGFPKGRRECGESDYFCAIREFAEETGLPADRLHKIRNIVPYEEIFMGSNYKSYKHKYYLMFVRREHSGLETPNCTFRPNNEISCIEWKSFDECMRAIRFYNVEKRAMLAQIHQYLSRFKLYELR